MFHRVVARNKPTVMLPYGYRSKFIRQYNKMAADARDQGQDAFDDMIQMMGTSIPKESSAEDVADYWLSENRRNY